MLNLLLLMLLFAVKHFLADVTFQTEPQTQGKGKAKGWFIPLLCHAGTHGMFTAMIMTAWTRSVNLGLLCGIFDTISHFIIDRIKSSPHLLGKYRSSLWLIIADQCAHGACYLVIIFCYQFWTWKLDKALLQILKWINH